MNNWKLRHSFTGNATSDVQTVNGYLASGEDNDFAVTVVPDGKEYAAPLFIPRTNLLLQSNQFDTTWNTNGTFTGGQTGYDGSSDAWEFVTASAGHNFYQSVSPSGVNTFSLYVKGDGSTGARIYLFGPNASVFFKLLDDGEITSISAEIVDASITPLSGSSGWYRISCAFYDDGTSSGGYQNVTRIYVYTTNNATANAAGTIYVQDAQLQTGSVATEYIPTTTEAVTRDWSAFGRVQNQLPGISNGTHTHTGAASGSGIAATTITGSGSGATFAYEFDTLGVLTTLTADGAGSGYKVGDKLSIDTTEGHTIEFRLVDGSNAATVSVSMDATRPNKPIPFPVSKMRVEGLTDRTVLFLDRRSQYVFPKPTPYLLDTYEGAAAAYSLRRLRSAYTGPAVRVRRASNNDELDIYFNGDGSLDTATLEAFCAGTDGFVSVWYDQGQGGNNAEQGATGAQPQIVSSGSVIPENGKPTIQFDDVDDELVASNLLTELDNSDFLISAVYENQLSIGSTGTVPRLYMQHEKWSYNTLNTMTWTALSGQALLSYQVVGATQEAFGNGTSLASATEAQVDFSPTDFLIGRVGSSDYAAQKLQELLVYASDQSSNRTAIEDNINEHYGIYP